MSNTETSVGLGASLLVNAETQAFSRLFKGLQTAGINTIDADDAHITIMYPEETMFRVNSKPEERVLERVRERIGGLLSGLHVHCETFTPDSFEVEPLGYRKNKVGLFIAEANWFADVRDNIKDIYHVETGLHVGYIRKPYRPHLSLGSKSGAAKRTDQKHKLSYREVKVPQNFHVTGYDISEETVTRTWNTGGSPPKDDSHYRNNPRGCSSQFG